MDTVGSEVGLKMRSAIKAKLMELGCYVDDELPDYVMVMVANKRTRHQMEEDLQLFLTANTHAFVGWLHQVLQKLQEVTVNTGLASMINPALKSKKLHKEKDKKKDKDKGKTKLKKAKKEKPEKSVIKSKTSKNTRLNIPPLLMNLEKESSPSITDVFAGQILKSHGITLNHTVATVEKEEKKPIIDITEITDRFSGNRKRFQVIDPESVPSIDENVLNKALENPKSATSTVSHSKSTNNNAVVAEDEDVIDIRIGQKEFNDFSEDSMTRDEVQFGSGKGTNDDVDSTSNVPPKKKRNLITAPETSDEPPRRTANVPNNSKRSIRERLGIKSATGSSTDVFKRQDSVEATENRKTNSTITRSRISWPTNTNSENDSRRKIRSRIIPIQPEPFNENDFRSNVSVASIIRAPPKPKPKGNVAPPQLLLKAVADSHKSLLSKPPKIEIEPTIRKKTVTSGSFDPKKIVIQVPSHEVSSNASIMREYREPSSDTELNIDTESIDFEEDEPNERNDNHENCEYVPKPIDKNLNAYQSVNYVPSHIDMPKNEDRSISPDVLLILNSKQAKAESNPQFVVTLDGVNTNLFLEKKLVKECEEEAIENTEKPILRSANDNTTKRKPVDNEPNVLKEKRAKPEKFSPVKREAVKTKSEKLVTKDQNKKSAEITSPPKNEPLKRKRNVSPIIFDSKKVNSEKKTSNGEKTNNNKYDSLPILPTIRKRNLSAAKNSQEVCKFYPDCKLGPSCEYYHPLTSAALPSMVCSAFPSCPYKDKCAYTHPSCKYGVTCIKRDCPYNHTNLKAGPLSVNVSSNYKPASTSICKYYPNCMNPGCHFYHPKPCRFGKYCANKYECNFYHHDSSTTRWSNKKL